VNTWNGFNVLGFFTDVVHQDGASLFGSTAGHAFTDFDTDSLSHFRRVADLKAEAQLLCALIEQKDGENLVVDDPLHHLSHTLHQRIEVERGVEHVSHFNQKRFNINALRLCGGNHRVHS